MNCGLELLVSIVELFRIALPVRILSNLSKHLSSISFEGCAWVVVNSNIWWIFQSTLNVCLNTIYCKEEKNYDMLFNHYYDVLYDWQREIQSSSDRGLLAERTSSNDNRSSNDESDRSGKFRQLDGYTVSSMEES